MLEMSASSVYKDFRCRRTRTTHQKRVNSLNRLFIELVVGDVAPTSTCLCSCWRQTFWAYDVKLMWLTTRLTASRFVVFNDSLKCTCKYWIDGSICHFKFPNVVLAHVLGEVGILFIVLLSVSSRTCLPIFIEIDSYLSNTKQKISWHIFETRCTSWQWNTTVTFNNLTATC